MTNEFGEVLDRNGYAPSIISHEQHCFCCYKNLPLERHEIFHGANRQKSKKYGLWVLLCQTCHYEVHNSNGWRDKMLKEIGQTTAMTKYGWNTDEFRKRFGRNYL